MPSLLENDKLAAGITSRNRRRRKPTNNEKENVPTASSGDTEYMPAPGIKTKTKAAKKAPISKKATTTTAKRVAKKKPSKKTLGAAEQSWVWKYTTYQPKEDVLDCFREALDTIPVKEVETWKQDESLTKSLVEASLSLPQVSESATTMYALEDETTSRDVLSTCRKIVKLEAGNAAKPNPDEVEGSLQGLFASVHGLRALSVLSPEIARSEAILRLLYHLITAGSSLLTTLHEQKAKATSKKKNSKIDRLMELAETTCFAGYQAMCHILKHFSIPSGKTDGKTIEFEICDHDNHPSQWSSLFEVPILVERGPQKASSTMTVAQVFTISAQSTLAIAKMMANSTLHDTGPFSCFPNSPTGHDEELPEQLAPAQSAASYLIIGVGLSWASFVSNGKISDKDGAIAKETVSFCQRAHRILWELSSRICKTSEGGQKGRDGCLELRKHALLILLGQSLGHTASYDSLSTQSSTGKYLREKHFENICAMASKTATNYFQQQSSLERPELTNFHLDLGSSLDNAVSCLPETTESVSYVEYCAHRALHVRRQSKDHTTLCRHDKSPCLFSDINLSYSHREPMIVDGDFHKRPLSLTLSLFFATLQLRDNILQAISQSEKHESPIAEHPSGLVDTSLIQAIIRNFHSVFLVGAESYSLDVLLGCFKLLTLVPLHSTIFKVTSLPMQDLVNSDEIDNLSAAAEILARCIGPFTAQLLANMGDLQDSKKEAYMRDLVVECFARAGILWDTLHGVKAPTDAIISHIECAESSFLNLADFIGSIDDNSVASRNLIEKSAKIFASLGKRRAGRNDKKAALDPLLRSILLFNRLVSKEDNISKYNISARWSMIAGIYQSIGWTDAASLATLLTITCNFTALSSMDVVGERGNRVNDILGVLGSSTHGIVETGSETLVGSDINRMCIRRLVDNLLENGGKPTSADCIPLSTKGAIELLITITLKASARKGEGSKFSRLYSRHVGHEFTMVSLLRAVCGRDTLFVHGALVELLVSILEVCGKTLQRASEEPSNEALVSYEGVAIFLVEILRSLPNTQEDSDVDDSAAILSATALIAASSSLLVESSIFNSISLGTPGGKIDNQVDHSASLLPLALNLANQACQIIGHERQDFSEKNRLVSAVRSAISLYRRNLLAVANDAPQLNNNADDEGMTFFGEDTLAGFSSSEAESKITKSARVCMSWTLGRLRDRLSFQGDRLHASQVAIWHNCLVTNADGIRKQWANALATNTLVASGLLDVALETQDIQENNRDDGSKTVFDESDLWTCWQTLVSTEQQVVKLRLQLCSGLPAETDSIEELLHEKLNDAESIQSESNSDIIVTAMSWIRSSILFVLSEADEGNGDFQQAIVRVRMSYQACQEVIASEDVLKSRVSVSRSGYLTRTILPSLVIRSFEKQIECLQRTANLYARLGDHRRCTAYAFSALKNCNNPGMLAELTPKLKVPDLLSLFRRVEIGSLQEESCRRQMIWLKALSSTNSVVVSEFMKASQEKHALVAGGRVKSTLRPIGGDRLSELEDRFTIGNYLHVSKACQGETIYQLFGRASQLYERILDESWYQHLLESFTTISPSVSPDRLLTPIYFELQLGEIRTLLADTAGVNEKEIAAKCLNIANANAAPRDCRVWALYYLGLSELETARKTGALSRLWSGYSNISDDGMDNNKRRYIAKCIQNARSHFLAALPLVGPASEILTRNMLRSLALVTGPDCDSKTSSMSTCLLIHTSIGCTARQELSQRFRGDHDVANALKALDTSSKSTEEKEVQVVQLFSKLGQCVEPGWRFVAATMCPTGEILSTSLSIDGACHGIRAETACIFPKTGESNSILYDEIMKPLDAIIRKSQHQLQGITTASDANTKFNDTSSKRGWWNERKQVDMELQDLLAGVERTYFDTSSVRQVLFGCDESPFLDGSFDSSDSDDSASIICGNLSSKFDAVYETPRRKSRGRSSDVILDDDSDKVRKESVSSKQNNTSRRSNRRTRSTDSSSSGSFSYRKQAPRTSLSAHSNNEGGNCTFVILDENLHRFPIEGLPSFAGRSVCRLPSLSFALAPFFQTSLSKPEMPGIDAVNARYIIDPESNLGATQERLLPFVEKATTKHSWKWRGVVGEMPSSEFMEESLQQENGMLLFCGHGGGQRCFSRSQVEGLADNVEGDSKKGRGCRSSIVLMGCSSGKLESVNRKGSDSISNEPLFCEPEGIALSYLLAGAPCVVANLWDVTDHDVDRYCLDLLERVLESPTQGTHSSMAQAVSEARAVCKMPYIVGCAPVCYGLPVSLLDNSSGHKPLKKKAGAKRR